MLLSDSFLLGLPSVSALPGAYLYVCVLLAVWFLQRLAGLAKLVSDKCRMKDDRHARMPGEIARASSPALRSCSLSLRCALDELFVSLLRSSCVDYT